MRSRKRNPGVVPARRRPERGREQETAPPNFGQRVWWRAALLALVVVLTYANSLHGPFILDDQASVVQNRSIRDLSRLDQVLASEPDSPVAGRPLVNLSFAINHALGGLDVRGYRAANIALHLACALLVFGVARRTFELPRVRQYLSGDPVPPAFAAALIWAVHPLNSEVVNYLSQRTEALMAVFLLLTLYASVRAVSTVRAGAWQTLAIVACGLGMACKESMAVAPILVALYDRVYLFDSWRDALRRRRVLYAGLAATWVVLGGLMAGGARTESAGFSAGVSVWTYLLNQTVMIARYLRLAIWPDSLVVFYGWPVPLTLADVMPYALLITGLLVLAAVALIRVPLPGFLGAWFFITLAPASSIVPIATEVGAERRMYLPLVALAMLAVLGARFLWTRATRAAPSLLAGGAPASRWRAATVMPAVALTAVAGAMAAGTVARNDEYASSLTLARTVIERWPTAVGYHVLGEELTRAGRHDEAIVQLREAVARGNSRAGYQLGIQLFNQERFEEAIEHLEMFVATANLPYRLEPRWLEPSTIEVLTSRAVLATAHGRLRQWPQAEEHARLVLQAAPGHRDARGALADALYAQERWAEAAVEYRAYLKAAPDSVAALINLGVAEIALDRLDDAVAAFRRAVAADPRSATAHRFLAMAMEDSGDLPAAARHAREAIALGADDPVMRQLAGGTANTRR